MAPAAWAQCQQAAFHHSSDRNPGQIRAAESTQNKLAEGGGIIPSPKHQRNTVEENRSAHHPTRIHLGEKQGWQGRAAASLADLFLAHRNKQDMMSFATAFETRGANSGCVCFKVLGRRFWFCRLLLKLTARGSRASGKKSGGPVWEVRRARVTQCSALCPFR